MANTPRLNIKLYKPLVRPVLPMVFCEDFRQLSIVRPHGIPTSREIAEDQIAHNFGRSFFSSYMASSAVSMSFPRETGCFGSKRAMPTLRDNL